MKTPAPPSQTGRGKFLGIVNDRLVGPIMSQIRHNLSPSKRAHVLGLTSRFEAAGGQLSGLLEIWWVALAHVADCWGFGHGAVVVMRFNQRARCPPAGQASPALSPNTPTPNGPGSHHARLCCRVRLSPRQCLHSPIGAASKTLSRCSHVSRDGHTVRRTAMAGFMRSSMMAFASSPGASATASGITG
jgi:hypothetical protein